MEALTFPENLMVLLMVVACLSGVFALASAIFEHLIPWLIERRRWRRARANTLLAVASRRTR